MNTLGMSKDERCHYCGHVHETVCPLIGRIEFAPGGMVTAVEMRDPLPFSTEHSDDERSVTLTGSYEDVRRWQRDKLQ